MKVSVSLPDDDVRFLDTFAESRGYNSRSAVVHEAIRILRSGDLADAYDEAWRSWSAAEDAEAWDATVADGLE